jgi:integrase
MRWVEARAVETSHRLRDICGQVFRYGIATGRCERDVAADLRGALQPVKVKHHAAMTNPKELAGLLRAIDSYKRSSEVTVALKLAPLVFTRPGELRQARWADVSLKTAEWRFEASKTKQPHIVPLSTQAVALLEELQPISGHSEWLFPSPRTSKKPMSDNAVLAALRRMGIPKEEMTGHGFRAIARTILDEVLKFPAHLIEHQLAHSVRDPLGRAYNRTTHLEERRAMMQRWSDYLDELRSSDVR